MRKYIFLVMFPLAMESALAPGEESIQESLTDLRTLLLASFMVTLTMTTLLSIMIQQTQAGPQMLDTYPQVLQPTLASAPVTEFMWWTKPLSR